MFLIEEYRISEKTATKISAAAMIISCSVPSVSNTAAINPDKLNNYDNFAEALQISLCFYDANKCGDKVADDGYYSWRGNYHVKDAEFPVHPMTPMLTVDSEKRRG